MRFSPLLLMFIAVALLSALLMPPDFANALRGIDTLFAPVASPARKVGQLVNNRFSGAPDVGKVDLNTIVQLREENNALKIELARLTGQYEEACRQLGEMSRIGADIRKLCRFASVIGEPLDNRQMLVLDGSSAQGFAKNMPVLSPDGLVGRLEQVGLSEVRVRLLTDLGMNVQVEFDRADTKDLVRLSNVTRVASGDGHGRLVIDDFPRVDFKANGLRIGDWVMLQDGDWPAVLQRYKVGTIEQVKEVANPLFVNLVVRPDNDLTKLQEVMVLVRNR